MTIDKTSEAFGGPGREGIGDDFRARILHQQAENAARRKSELTEQSSGLNSAEERIRIWERLHEIRLPRDPDHRLVDIIAANTGLTDGDVRHEQRRRAELRQASGAAVPAAPTAG